MGTKYHYDRHGNYRGKTTDEPPADDGCIWIFVLVFLFVCMSSGGC